MAELVIECPPPDGHMDYSNNTSARSDPPTNLRIREFLKKHHEYQPTNGSAGESGNSSDDQQRQLANHSPPPNCSICLGRVKSKCFTDSCMHQFCFSCLLEWSKVKPECPLCKQTFKSIIHNVTSMDNYEEYKVEAQQRHVNWINLPFQPGDVDMNILLSASLPTYPMHRPDHLVRNQDSTRRRLYQLFRQDSPLVQRFAQTYPDEVYPNRVSGTQWRQYIYNRRLYAEPLTDLGGQSRNISAEFYRANPAQMHRLVPWLNRELLCLCEDQPISYTVQRIGELIQTYDMTSFEFQSRIQNIVPNHTEHFIHELINYSRSPYDLIGYDRFVTYLPRFEGDSNDVVTLSSSEESSDVEFVGPIVPIIDVESTEQNTINVESNQNGSSNDNETISNSSNNSSNSSDRNESIDQSGASTSGIATAPQGTVEVNISNLSGDDSDEEEIKSFLRHKPNVSAEELIRGRTGSTPVPTVSTPSNSSHQNHSETSESTQNIEQSNSASTSSQANVDASTQILEITPKVEHNSQTKSTPEIINSGDGSDSDSDECLFVCAKKPPHLRTPEYVELNSDTDSDVVFVSSETCQTPMQSITTSQLEAANEMTKSLLTALTAAHSNETTTRRKRSRAAESNASAYPNQDTSNTYEQKPSTSETMLQWLIQSPDDYSRRIPPKSSARQQSPPNNRPRLTTTIKISRGKRIYETSSDDSSDQDNTTDPESSSTSTSNSFDSSDVGSSSHEEYVCSSSRARTKRPANNNDGRALAPRKKYRKRRGKQIFETSSEDSSEDDE